MPPQIDPRTMISLLGEGRAAFKTADYVRSEELFQAALEAGADELDCRQHLARIYNLSNDWSKALQQWLWLQEHAEGRLRAESQLQVARGYFRLKNYDAAVAAFKEVLASQPDHAEARRRLLQISERKDDAWSAGTTADRAEAPKRVQETDTLVGSAGELPAAEPRSSVADANLVDEAKAAFNEDKLEYSRVLFIRAIEQGADEAICRLHLARICNLQEEWEQALEHWKWLRDQDTGKLEPYLQIGRAELNRGAYAAAVEAFERVLALAPDHAEAKDRLQQARTFRKQSEEEDLAEGGSWLSHVPEALRWQLAKDALHIGNASTKAALDMAVETLASLDRLIQAFGEMKGDMLRHRQLYALQAAGQVEQARRELKKVRALARAIDRRTMKVIQISGGEGAGKPGSDRPHSNGAYSNEAHSNGLRSNGPVPPRLSWRGAETTAAVEAFRDQGFDAAVLSVLRGCPPDRHAAALSSLGEALEVVDKSAAIRAYWLSFGANPSQSNARHLSVKLSRSGDLANSTAMAIAGRRLDGANGQSQGNRAVAED